ncbi:MAG: chemotaxis protein CheW, partial [Desulfurococcales archaeon]|nr:chemotaxis protein CheW [Desulfurococcales archaeon]
MKLPPSLAVIYAIIVKVGNERYAVPVASIERIININKENVKSVAGREVVYTSNKEIIPLYRLSKLFSIRTNGESQALIVRYDKGRYALAVDYVEELESVVVKPLGRLVKNVKGIAGATILGDGRVCLIIDPYTLVSSYEYPGGE